jgi:Transposase DDE domain
MVVLKSPTNRRPRMAIISSTLARIKADPLGPLGGAERVNQLFTEAGHVWRKCSWDPATTLAMFILQVLHQNIAMTALRFLSDLEVNDATYCDARMRLPVNAVAKVVDSICGDCCRCIQETRLWLGRRVFVADATSASTPDKPVLQDLWPQPAAQKPGCGFPVIKLLGLLDLVTGMVVQLTMMCMNVHEMSQLAGLNAVLKAGDVLLADRGFCSFVHVVMLLKSSVDAVFRMHQRQGVDFTPNRPHRGKRGKCAKRGMPTSRYVQRLGFEDHVVAWARPQKPDWMSAAEYALMPEWVEVRELRYHIVARGRRTRVVTIATTLLDAMLFSKQEIAKLYGLRWEIETNFRHLKTTMKMEHLKCETMEGVLKELMIFVLVYNLIRAAMAMAGERQGVDPNRISFIDAARWLRSQCTPPKRKQLAEVDLNVNPPRPGRWHPRVIKRRIKPYDLMNKPRHEYTQPDVEQELAA